MTRLAWDQPGSKTIENGVDRGVLYLPDGSPVAWNGLTAVSEDAPGGSIEEYYLDGVKYLSRLAPGDFSGTIKALTYPDEFMQFDGVVSYDDGIYATQQPVRNTFGLCYRTRKGNDIDGLDSGYKLHILYNLTAKTDTRTYATLGSTSTPQEFSWTITGVPVAVTNLRPTVHFILDSTELHPGVMAVYEDQLYGTASASGALPDANTLVQMQNNAF